MVNRTLCLIPAKGSSTRLVQKNMSELGGRPLLGWAIKSARDCGIMDRTVVSTEDPTIAIAARKLGADVPFLRPQNLAKDPVGVSEVALHTLAFLREQGEIYETLVILLPTCPLRSTEDIHNAFSLFQQQNAKFLMSVSRFEHTPFAAMTMDESGHLSPCFPEFIGKRSQEMPLAFRANGAIHILNVEAFEETRSYYSQPLVAYEMPRERSIDIDTIDDLKFAESLLTNHT